MEGTAKDILHVLAIAGEFILGIVALVIVVVFIKVMVAGEPTKD